MATALAFVVPAVFGAGGAAALVGGGIGAAGLTWLGVAVNVAGSLLLSAAANALTSQEMPSVDPANVKLNIKNSTSARVKHYGRVRAGGTVAFARASEGVYFRVIVHGHGQIHSPLAYYVDNNAVEFDGSGNVTTGRYVHDGEPRVGIQETYGTDPGYHFTHLASYWPEWDTSHTMDGLWATAVWARQTEPEAFNEMWPNGEPEFEVLAQTSEVYDPRGPVTAYSENAALIIADFIESEDGFNLSGRVNAAQLIVAANDCDDAISLDAGGTEPRYQISGSHSMTDAPLNGVEAMLRACAGEIRLEPDGTIGIYAGVWDAPTVTITTEDVIAIEEYTTGPDKLDRYTELPITYVERELEYVETSADPWIDSALEAEYGEAAIGSILRATWCQSHTQARRLGKIKTAYDNPASELTLKLKPRGLRAMYERFVAVSLSEYGINGNYRVTGYSLSPLDASLTLQLKEIAASAFDWDETTEEGTPPVVPASAAESVVPSVIDADATGLGLRVAAGTYSAGISVTWDDPENDALVTRVRYSHSLIPGFLPSNVFEFPSAAGGCHLTGLEDGVDYEVEIWNATSAQTSAVVTLSDVTALAAADAPDTPTSLSVSDAGGGVASISVTAPNDETVWKIRILRDSVTVSEQLADPLQVITFSDAAGLGTFDWTAQALNVSSVASTQTAAVTLELT